MPVMTEICSMKARIEQQLGEALVHRSQVARKVGQTLQRQLAGEARVHQPRELGFQVVVVGARKAHQRGRQFRGERGVGDQRRLDRRHALERRGEEAPADVGGQRLEGRGGADVADPVAREFVERGLDEVGAQGVR